MPRGPDAAFFGIGARLSDLDKPQARLIICIQTNWWTISFDADLTADGLFATAAVRNAGPPRLNDPHSVRVMTPPSLQPREMEHRMSTRSQLLALAAASAAVVVSLGTPAVAQTTIKIGELNSYKSQPAFLEPYKKGWELAVEEINAKGGVLGKKLEVISRDDGATPGDAVRVAQELVTREGVNIIAGTFFSHIGLAVTEFAGKEKVFFLAAEPLTDKITWQNGNKYTFRLRASTYMQVAMLMPAAIAAKKKRWALVYHNFEFGQSAATWFKEMLKKAQPDVEFVTEQAPPLGKVDAGAVVQAIDDAKPDAIFNALFGPDLAKLVREGTTRGTFKNRPRRQPALRRTGISRSAQGRGTGRLDRDWVSLGRDRHAGPQGVRRRLSEALERLSTAGFGGRL